MHVTGGVAPKAADCQHTGPGSRPTRSLIFYKGRRSSSRSLKGPFGLMLGPVESGVLH